MATVINNPGPSMPQNQPVGSDSSSSSFIVGLIIVVLLLVLFFAFGLPAMRRSGKSGGGTNINGTLNVNPGGQPSNSGGGSTSGGNQSGSGQGY